MKKDKRILLAITGIALLLGGCGANQPKQKTNNHKEAKTENVKSTTQSSMVSKTDSTNSSNDVAFGQKISNDEFYVMAYAKNEHLTLDKLLGGSKNWVFPSASMDDPSYAFYKEDNYNCIGDSSGSNEGSTHLINVDNNNVTIAHLESTAPKQDHAEFTYQNLTFSKQDLIKEFLTSKDQVNELAQITQNMKNNENQATKDIAKIDDDSSSSSQSNNGNVDTKDLTTQQVNNWVYQAMLKIYYSSDNDKPPMDAYVFEQTQDDSGCVEILVRENHDSDWMKKKCPDVDQDVTPTIATFRVDAQGNLQQNDYGDGGWKDTNIPYPGN